MKKIILLLACIPAFGQISHVQSVGGTGSSISITPKAVGDALVVFCSTGSSAVAISDSQSNSWLAVDPTTTQPGGGVAGSFLSLVKATTSDKITCTGSGWNNIMVDEFKGVASVSSHVTATGTGTNASTTALSVPAGSVLWAGANGTISKANSPFTAGASDKSSDSTEYYIPANAVSQGASFANSGEYTTLAAVLAPAGTGSAPIVNSLSARPSSVVSGSSSTISWSTNGATSVTLNAAMVALNGSQSVTPSQTTNYTLLATNQYGSTSQSTTVVVTQVQATSVSIAAGAISCTVSNNSGVATIACNWATGSASDGNITLPQTIAPGWQLNYTLGSDSVSITMTPTGSGWTVKSVADGTTQTSSI